MSNTYVVRKTLQLSIFVFLFSLFNRKRKKLVLNHERLREVKWMNKKRSKVLYLQGWICEKPSFTPTDLQHFFMFMLDNIFCTHTWIKTKEKVQYHAPPAPISVREVLISVEAPKTEKSEIYCIEKGSLKPDKWTRKFTFIRSYVKIPMWVGVTLV